MSPMAVIRTADVPAVRRGSLTLNTGTPGGVVVEARCLQWYRVKVPMRVDARAAAAMVAVNGRMTGIRWCQTVGITVAVVLGAFQCVWINTDQGLHSRGAEFAVEVSTDGVLLVVLGFGLAAYFLGRSLRRLTIPQHPARVADAVYIREVNAAALADWAAENPGAIRATTPGDVALAG